MAVLIGDLTIIPLPPDFQPGGFSCGEAEVDYYLQNEAITDQVAGVTKTHLIKDGDRVVAYVSILADAIRLAKDERVTHRQAAPAIKVGLMGVCTDYRTRRYQDRTIGCWTLDWVVGLAVTVGQQIGIRYVTLDALPREKLVVWYSRYGFVKNVGETLARQTLKRAGSSALKKFKPEEIELPHISMRYDIKLQPQI